jgi:hypothetical protein
MQFRKTLSAAFGIFLVAAFFLSLPLTAQDVRTHGRGGQANLQITVNLVPAVGHHHRDKDKNNEHKGDSVLYDLNSWHDEFSVTEEDHSMLLESDNHVARQEQVRTISIVLK